MSLCMAVCATEMCLSVEGVFLMSSLIVHLISLLYDISLSCGLAKSCPMVEKEIQPRREMRAT